MTTKPATQNPILEAVHETASDPQRVGFIDRRKTRKFELLCLDPIPDYASKKIWALSDRFRLSQAVLASVLNTSLFTVRQWEVGQKHPSGPSQKFLNLRAGSVNLRQSGRSRQFAQ